MQAGSPLDTRLQRNPVVGFSGRRISNCWPRGSSISWPLELSLSCSMGESSYFSGYQRVAHSDANICRLVCIEIRDHLYLLKTTFCIIARFPDTIAHNASRSALLSCLVIRFQCCAV